MDLGKFHYRSGELFCEDMSVAEAAKNHGTPVFVYSKNSILESYRRMESAFKPVNAGIHYAVKANSNLSILKLLKDAGAGFDVVSGGEIRRLLRVGADPGRIVYAGVGKSEEDLTLALRQGIRMFNVENARELRLIDDLAGKLGVTAEAALRINPDVDPETHTYITTGKKDNKFGLDLRTAESLLAELPSLKRVRVTGLHMHLGSFLTKVEPYVESIRRALQFVEVCKRRQADVRTLNIGGGFAIEYNEPVLPVAAFAQAIVPLVRDSGLQLQLEPGRFLVGNSAILLCRVLYVKDIGTKRFVIVDGGMNDVIRPALYQAYHRVWPVKSNVPVDAAGAPGLVLTDVVGPVCESGDFFARDRMSPVMEPGELVALFSAGAYCFSMSSNYNARGRAAEVMVDGSAYRLIRERESIEHQYALEEKFL